MPEYMLHHRRRAVSIAPTWAALHDDDAWHFTLRVWASKENREQMPDGLVAALTEDADGLDAEERCLLAERTADLLAYNNRDENITFQFDRDPEPQVFAFPEHTDANGIVKQEFSLPRERAKAIATAQGRGNGWLSITATLTDGEVEGHGRIRLLDRAGLSVFSDIDDTIRVTGILEGHATVLRTTLLRPFVAVDGMRERYAGYGGRDVAFHYLSGGVWQLQGVLETFLMGERGFPQGTFHMRSAPTNPFDPSTWRGLHQLIAQGSTFEHKTREIRALMNACPDRQVVLIGDSGEQDPEIYAAILKEFGKERVKEILIRDVRGDQPSRLAGMTVIPA